ncbi:MAG TPA: hypothetical protein VN795_04890 [Stellaceae bacterium]|jgi:hypothetical protein|nr:hypothetical protein [Stellaceae bacterium]
MNGAGYAIPAAVLAAVTAAANPDGAALTRLGLAGEWAVDCRQAISDANPHVTFATSDAAPGDQSPRYIESGPNGAVGTASIGNIRALAGGQISLTMTVTQNLGGESAKIVMDNVLIKDGNRFRFLEVKANGQASVSGGITKANGEATQWLQRCGG